METRENYLNFLKEALPLYYDSLKNGKPGKKFQEKFYHAFKNFDLIFARKNVYGLENIMEDSIFRGFLKLDGSEIDIDNPLTSDLWHKNFV